MGWVLWGSEKNSRNGARSERLDDTGSHVSCEGKGAQREIYTWRPNAELTDLCPYISDVSRKTNHILTYLLRDIRQGIGCEVLGSWDPAPLLLGAVFDWNATIHDVESRFVIWSLVREVCKVLQHLVLDELHSRVVPVDLVFGYVEHEQAVQARGGWTDDIHLPSLSHPGLPRRSSILSLRRLSLHPGAHSAGIDSDEMSKSAGKRFQSRWGPPARFLHDALLSLASPLLGDFTSWSSSIP